MKSQLQERGLLNRRWVIVEDMEANLRAYLRAWEAALDLEVVCDPVDVFIFDESKIERNTLKECKAAFDKYEHAIHREDQEKSAVPRLVLRKDGTEVYRFFVIEGRESLEQNVLAVSESPEKLILLFDVLLERNGVTLQDNHSILKEWKRLEERHSEDLIGLVTSEYYADDFLKTFGRKGFAGFVPLAGDEETRERKALDIIVKANEEWRRRYCLGGMRILNALMYAQDLGNNGHIDDWRDVPQEFPFFVAFKGHGRIESFKSLFHFSGSRAAYPACDPCVIKSILAGSGVTSDIEICASAGFVVLPTAPGALFIFRIWYLLRLLGEEKHANPVVKIQLKRGAKDLLETVLVFDKPIDCLINALDSLEGYSGGTVESLRAVTTSDQAVKFREDPKLDEWVENAQHIEPKPTGCSARMLKGRKLVWTKGVLKVVGAGKRIILRAES